MAVHFRLDLLLNAKVYAALMPSTTSSARHLTIGELAALADVSANAVRFYERQGLMQVPDKTGSGYRIYDDGALGRLRFIKQAQHCGFTLAEIQALLQLRDEASSCCNDVRSMVIEKKLELEARIKAMRAMSKALDQLIADCSDDARPAGDCPILATLSGVKDLRR
jgi:DNA-binding transcriptional MerR regulator